MNRKRRKSHKKRARFAIAAVEMAFVAPFVFLLVFGAIEFARMMMVRQAVTNAAREGCRNACLVTSRDTTRAHKIARNTLSGIVADSETTKIIHIEFKPPFITVPESGSEITTTVEISCDDVSWLPAFFTAGAKIKATCAMNRE